MHVENRPLPVMTETVKYIHSQKERDMSRTAQWDHDGIGGMSLGQRKAQSQSSSIPESPSMCSQAKGISGEMEEERTAMQTECLKCGKAQEDGEGEKRRVKWDK